MSPRLLRVNSGLSDHPGVRRFRLPLCFVLAACGVEAPAPVREQPGPDCTALIDAGERARACDPAIDALLAELRARPDESRCRMAARQLLAPPAPGRGRIVSVYEQPSTIATTPLTADEHAELATLPLPGSLVISPDMAPRPGVPATTAMLADVPLELDSDGRLRGKTAPGEHTLVVRHANAEVRACVRLRACESVALTAHGASLAPHASLRTGPCEPDP